MVNIGRLTRLEFWLKRHNTEVARDIRTMEAQSRQLKHVLTGKAGKSILQEHAKVRKELTDYQANLKNLLNNLDQTIKDYRKSR